ncbi:MAG: quercetin 2,3-dioxygenase [Saprospiraceae bacterium]|nr:MAG: quercetin 2,3-dioxygenase [Saprospiraceae bacterium]
MPVRIITKERQARGAFNGGEIIENKPIGFPREGGEVRPYSNLFYWAHAQALTDSTIGLHPHEGFEIMSFVLKGSIRHYDTKLNEWRPLKAGDAQIIRAGSGISHAEFMAKDSAMFQIWFDPDLSKTLSKPASYDDYKSEELPLHHENGISVKTYIGEGSPITLDTPGLEVLRFTWSEGAYRHPVDDSKIYSLYVLDGHVSVNGHEAGPDDFVIVEKEPQLLLGTQGPADVFMIASLAVVPYRTYARMFART